MRDHLDKVKAVHARPIREAAMSHLIREHQFELALPLAIAFPLFTPRGEMAWVPGWRPIFLHPVDGEPQEGMVFTTGAGDDLTFWSCIEWSPEQHRVRYARVTPTSRFVHVTVACTLEGPCRTCVLVRYEMTALTVSGEAFLASLSEEAFCASIGQWKVLIETLSD